MNPVPTIKDKPLSPDKRLRKRGFKIHARKGNEEPVWQRRGRLYKQSEALRLIEWEERA